MKKNLIKLVLSLITLSGFMHVEGMFKSKGYKLRSQIAKQTTIKGVIDLLQEAYKSDKVGSESYEKTKMKAVNRVFAILNRQVRWTTDNNPFSKNTGPLFETDKKQLFEGNLKEILINAPKLIEDLIHKYSQNELQDGLNDLEFVRLLVTEFKTLIDKKEVDKKTALDIYNELNNFRQRDNRLSSKLFATYDINTTLNELNKKITEMLPLELEQKFKEMIDSLQANEKTGAENNKLFFQKEQFKSKLEQLLFEKNVTFEDREIILQRVTQEIAAEVEGRERLLEFQQRTDGVELSDDDPELAELRESQKDVIRFLDIMREKSNEEARKPKEGSQVIIEGTDGLNALNDDVQKQEKEALNQANNSANASQTQSNAKKQPVTDPSTDPVLNTTPSNQDSDDNDNSGKTSGTNDDDDSTAQEHHEQELHDQQENQHEGGGSDGDGEFGFGDK